MSGPAGSAGATAERPRSSHSPRWEWWRHFRRNRLAVAGLVVIVLAVLAAIFADVIARYPYAEVNPADANLPPFSGDHWFGTDNLGRDTFAQVVHGARVSLRVGFLVAVFATGFGVLFGGVSGYVGGIVDDVAMRIVDVFLSIPHIILTVAVVGVIGRDVNAVVIALSVTGWFVTSRIVRAGFLQLKEQDFVQAARVMGYSRARIVFRHILPNTLQPVIVYATLFIGTAILAESALSFLAIGVLPPTPSWGLLVAQNKGLLTESPHLVLLPGGAIFLVVVSFVFVGDGARDALDPRRRG